MHNRKDSGSRYDGEWGHVSRQLIALAEATPADEFSWRPAPGVRSMSEVFMHIALANFYLLSVTGPKMPDDLKSAEMEKTVTAKQDVISWLKRSLEAVKTAHASLKPGDLQKKVKIMKRDADVDGMYLRIIVHANEHMWPADRLCSHERHCAAVVLIKISAAGKPSAAMGPNQTENNRRRLPVAP